MGAADILHLAVTGAEDFWRAGADGTTVRFHSASEQGVERRITFEGTIRLCLVQARGISPGIDVPEEPEPESSRRDGQARQLQRQQREAEPQRAAVNPGGLPDLFQLDRETAHAHAECRSPRGQISAVTMFATRKALAMIVSPGPTP